MAVYGILAVVLETTWLSGLPTSVVQFDFIIIAVAALSFYERWYRALPIIFLLGLLVDISSAGPFGLSILSYMMVYGLIRLVIAKISFQAGLALLFWVAIISIMNKVICSVVLLAVSGKMIFPEIIMKSAPAQALLDAALAVVIMPFIRWYWDLTWEKIARPKGLVMK